MYGTVLPLSTTESAYHGHVTLRTGLWSNGRRWFGVDLAFKFPRSSSDLACNGTRPIHGGPTSLPAGLSIKVSAAKVASAAYILVPDTAYGGLGKSMPGRVRTIFSILWGSYTDRQVVLMLWLISV